jgi:pimeloyl-ACP methyl ester carboxylesterase
MAGRFTAASHLVRSFIKESRAVETAFEDALFESHRMKSTPEKCRARALILPGYIAPRFVYHRLVKFLDAQKIFSAVATYGMSLRSQLLRNPEILNNTVIAFKERFGTIDYVIGHSAGTIDALSLITTHSEVRRAVAFAPPFALAPLPRMLLHVGSHIGLAPIPLHPRRVQLLMKRLLPHQERVVLVYTNDDALCRPARAVLPGAKHIVVEEKKTRKDDGNSHTHVGLPNSNFAKNILKRELTI